MDPSVHLGPYAFSYATADWLISYQKDRFQHEVQLIILLRHYTREPLYEAVAHISVLRCIVSTIHFFHE